MNDTKPTMRDYELINCVDISEQEIQEYFDEFNAVQECKVLRQLYSMSVNDWLQTLKTAQNTLFFGLYYHGRLVGVGRISHKPVHYSSGNVGYGIRPSERNKGYGSVLLTMLCNECIPRNIPARCCVESTNIASMKCMKKCGLRRNGKQYEWSMERTAYEYIK